MKTVCATLFFLSVSTALPAVAAPGPGAAAPKFMLRITQALKRMWRPGRLEHKLEPTPTKPSDAVQVQQGKPAAEVKPPVTRAEAKPAIRRIETVRLAKPGSSAFRKGVKVDVDSYRQGVKIDIDSFRTLPRAYVSNQITAILKPDYADKNGPPQTTGSSRLIVYRYIDDYGLKPYVWGPHRERDRVARYVVAPAELVDGTLVVKGQAVDAEYSDYGSRQEIEWEMGNQNHVLPVARLTDKDWF